MSVLANLLRLLVGLLLGLADSHPWGCHCDACMREVSDTHRRRIAEAARGPEVPRVRPVQDAQDRELASALVNLGYGKKQAQSVVAGLPKGTFKARFKEALRRLNQK